MPPKQLPLSELGAVEPHKDQFRAHVQYRNEEGLMVHIRGPDRRDRRRAQSDLEDMRAAGAVGSTREKGLQHMAGEARRIQMTAEFEAEVREAERLQRAAEEEVEVALSEEAESDGELWQLMDYSLPREEIATTPSQKQPLTPHEATVQLSAFRPIKACPEDLEHLLASRADPNLPITKPGDVSPLTFVIGFARWAHAAKMRQLLLDYGAKETDANRKSWELRERVQLLEERRMHEARLLADGDYDPCGAAMDSQW